MDKKIIIETWVYRGIRHLCFGYEINGRYWRTYQSFFEYMGLETLCKAYLLTLKANEFENLNEDDAIYKSNEIAKGFGHKLKSMLNKINDDIGENKIINIMKNDYDGFNGDKLVDVLEASFIETRYPIPKPISKEFVIEGTSFHWDPISSHGNRKLVYALSKEILISLKIKYGVGIHKASMESLLSTPSGMKFCNTIFGQDIDVYLI